MIGPHADLIVVGSGPTGLAAAAEASQIGLSVILLDEQATVGGQIYRGIDSAPTDRMDILGQDYGAGSKLTAEFRRGKTDYRRGAEVWSVTKDGAVDFVADGVSQEVTGKYVLLASGAMERPFPIAGWTLPGVMGAGAAQILLKASGAVPRTPVVLAGCGPLLFLLAWQYLRAGVQIRAVVDTTPAGAYLRAIRHTRGALLGWRDLAKGLKLLAAIRRSRVPIYSGSTELCIEGEAQVEAIRFKNRGKQVRISTSLLLLHQGVVPNTQLSLSTGAAHIWSAEQLSWQPVTDEWGRLGESSIYVAGDSRGIVGAQASAIQGRLAALAIGKNLGVAQDFSDRVAALRGELSRHTHIRPFLDALYKPLEENRIPQNDDTIVCRCEEVTAGQIRRYVELGCKGPNQTKAFGRCGMGPCQGRFCGLTVTETIAQARGVDPSDVGYYRIRPPVKPVMLGNFVQ